MSDMPHTSPYIEGKTLTYQRDGHVQTLIVGTPAWYAWLQTAATFTFTSDKGTFTARREQAGNKRGGGTGAPTTSVVASFAVCILAGQRR